MTTSVFLLTLFEPIFGGLLVATIHSHPTVSRVVVGEPISIARGDIPHEALVIAARAMTPIIPAIIRRRLEPRISCLMSAGECIGYARTMRVPRTVIRHAGMRERFEQTNDTWIAFVEPVLTQPHSTDLPQVLAALLKATEEQYRYIASRIAAIVPADRLGDDARMALTHYGYFKITTVRDRVVFGNFLWL